MSVPKFLVACTASCTTAASTHTGCVSRCRYEAVHETSTDRRGVSPLFLVIFRRCFIPPTCMQCPTRRAETMGPRSTSFCMRARQACSVCVQGGCRFYKTSPYESDWSVRVFIAVHDDVNFVSACFHGHCTGLEVGNNTKH